MYFIFHTVLYFPRSKVTRAHRSCHGSLRASLHGGSLLWRAHFESLRVAEAKNAATINHLMSKRQSVLYFPYSYLFSRVKGHKCSPALPRLLPSIVMGSLLRRAHFESLRAAEAKNSATINQLKYHSRSCITANIALGAWSRANKALGCASCFIGSRPHHRAIFSVMHSHCTLTSIYSVHVYTCIYINVSVSNCRCGDHYSHTMIRLP